MTTTTRRQFLKTMGVSAMAAVAIPSVLAFRSAPEGTDFKGKFTPDFKSLTNYQCPEWFRNAKFGIFLHYGMNTVAGMNGHYGRFMYMQKKANFSPWAEWGKDVYNHHCKTHGHPSKFGYKDFTKLWRADKFDAMELGAYFKSIGARYVVPVAVHCDNFDNWNSKYHRWNSLNMGPKIDFIGEWKKACDNLGLRFGVSEHMSTHMERWFHGSSDFDGPMKGVPYDNQDPRYEDFYLKRNPETGELVDPLGFRKHWYKRMQDLLDSYEPDLFYFDGSYPYRDTGEGVNIVTYFYNQNIKKNKGKYEAVMCIKTHNETALQTTCVDDIERGQTDQLREHPWQTDTTINQGWFYLGETDTVVTKAGEEAAMSTSKDKKLLDGPMCIQNLCDIVSKNGNLLLNVGQKEDGSIPENFKKDLDVIGAWLKINGEAIYDTRPWKVYGEGPTKVTAGHFKEPSKPFVAEDIRFTQKGNTLYTMAMGVPKGKLKIKSLGEKAGLLDADIKSVSLLGNPETMKWKQKKSSLEISIPNKVRSEHAIVFKIALL